MAKTDGTRRYTRPQPHKVAAIAEFLLEKKLVSASQLTAQDEIAELAQSLSVFLSRHGQQTIRPFRTEKFVSTHETSRHYVVEEQHVSRSTSQKFFDVTEITKIFSRSQFSDLSNFQESWRLRRPMRTKNSVGFMMPMSAGTAIKVVGHNSHSRERFGAEIVLYQSPEFDAHLDDAPQLRSIMLTYFPDLCNMTEIQRFAKNWFGVVGEDKLLHIPSFKRRAGGRYFEENLSKVLAEAFFRAAEEGDIHGVRRALAMGADPNYRDPASGARAIHVAGAFNDYELAELLMAQPTFNPVVKTTDGLYASDLCMPSLDLGDRLFEFEIDYARQHGIGYRDTEVEEPPPPLPSFLTRDL